MRLFLFPTEGSVNSASAMDPKLKTPADDKIVVYYVNWNLQPKGHVLPNLTAWVQYSSRLASLIFNNSSLILSLTVYWLDYRRNYQLYWSYNRC